MRPRWAGVRLKAMAEPREWAERLERRPELPPGNVERFAGYGVMSLPFASGHVLALRRVPASSLGPAYTSIWHRSPDDDWTFYSDAPPVQCCPRYFAAIKAHTEAAPIRLVWTSDRDLRVTLGGSTTLEWEVALAPTPATRLLSGLAAVIPEALWRERWVLATMGRLAGPLLGAGRLRLSGHAVNRQWFVLNPRRVWSVSRSRASLDGRDLGAPAPLTQQAQLADFWIPQRGLFMVGRAFFEPLDLALHVVPLATDRPSETVLVEA